MKLSGIYNTDLESLLNENNSLLIWRAIPSRLLKGHPLNVESLNSVIADYEDELECVIIKCTMVSEGASKHKGD